jgi:hypothetical protein
MGKHDKFDKIVEKLELPEVKKLAAQNLRNLVNLLEEEISRAAKIRRTLDPDDDPEQFMGSVMESYNETKSEMQKYGLWNDRYEEVFLKAKETGHFDAKHFYGAKLPLK